MVIDVHCTECGKMISTIEAEEQYDMCLDCLLNPQIKKEE